MPTIPMQIANYLPFRDKDQTKISNMPYYPGLGYGYPLIKTKQTEDQNCHKLSNLELLWQSWLENFKEKKEPFNVKIIAGELSNTNYTKFALNIGNCESVSAIFGRAFVSKESKDALAEMLDLYPTKLILYSLKDRPVNHKSMIESKNNSIIFYEDTHELGDDYQTAMIFEQIPPEHKILFQEEFNRYVKSPDVLKITSKKDIESIVIEETKSQSKSKEL